MSFNKYFQKFLKSIDYTVIKDGDMYIAHTEGFVNLQESDNYAFGETPNKAQENLYNKLFEKGKINEQN